MGERFMISNILSGHYGFYIISAFSLTGIVLIGCVITSIRTRRKIIHTIKHITQT